MEVSRCQRCQTPLSEEDMIDLELCHACFAQHPPCLLCGGREYVFRRGKSRMGTPIRYAVACPWCA